MVLLSNVPIHSHRFRVYEVDEEPELTVPAPNKMGEHFPQEMVTGDPMQSSTQKKTTTLITSDQTHVKNHLAEESTASITNRDSTQEKNDFSETIAIATMTTNDPHGVIPTLDKPSSPVVKNSSSAQVKNGLEVGSTFALTSTTQIRNHLYGASTDAMTNTSPDQYTKGLEGTPVSAMVSSSPTSVRIISARASINAETNATQAQATNVLLEKESTSPMTKENSTQVINSSARASSDIVINSSAKASTTAIINTNPAKEVNGSQGASATTTSTTATQAQNDLIGNGQSTLLLTGPAQKREDNQRTMKGSDYRDDSQNQSFPTELEVHFPCSVPMLPYQAIQKSYLLKVL